MSQPIAYTDLAGLSSLRYSAAAGKEDAVRGAAQQFAAMFVQMMTKAMRDATPEGGLFDSEDMKFYQQMFDQQYAISICESGSFELVDVIEQQLRGALPATLPDHPGGAANLTRLAVEARSMPDSGG